jgi:phage-related protein
VGHSIIPELIEGIRKWFQQGVDWVAGIVSWFGQLPGMFSAWLGSVVDWVQSKWALIKDYIALKINEIKTTISTVLDSIKTKWNEIWSAVATFVSGKIDDIKEFIGKLGEIPGKVKEWFGKVKDGIVEKFNDAVTFVQGIPGRITGALGNMGTLLYNSGRDVVQGMWNGIVNKWNEVIGQWNTMVDGLVNNVKRILGIASPSKVFAELGKQLPAGLVAGMDGQRGMVAAAAQRLSDAAAVFAPPLTLGGLTGAGAFTGQFGAVAPSGSAGAPVGGTQVANLTVNVQGILDPADPASFRRMARQIREAIIGLEREGYARG